MKKNEVLSKAALKIFLLCLLPLGSDARTGTSSGAGVLPSIKMYAQCHGISRSDGPVIFSIRENILQNLKIGILFSQKNQTILAQLKCFSGQELSIAANGTAAWECTDIEPAVVKTSVRLKQDKASGLLIGEIWQQRSNSPNLEKYANLKCN